MSSYLSVDSSTENVMQFHSVYFFLSRLRLQHQMSVNHQELSQIGGKIKFLFKMLKNKKIEPKTSWIPLCKIRASILIPNTLQSFTIIRVKITKSAHKLILIVIKWKYGKHIADASWANLFAFSPFLFHAVVFLPACLPACLLFLPFNLVACLFYNIQYIEFIWLWHIAFDWSRVGTSLWFGFYVVTIGSLARVKCRRNCWSLDACYSISFCVCTHVCVYAWGERRRLVSVPNSVNAVTDNSVTQPNREQ